MKLCEHGTCKHRVAQARRFCCVSCKMKWQHLNSKATKKAATKNLSAANSHPNSLKARRATMKKVASAWNEKKAKNPRLAKSVQEKATKGRRNSKKFRDSSRKTLTRIRKDPAVLKKMSKAATERARRYGIASTRRSTPVIYTDLQGDDYKMRSICEARFAYYCDNLGLSWNYEEYAVELTTRWCLPDFWVSDWNCFVEIKGYKTPGIDGRLQEIEACSGYEARLVTRADLDKMNAPLFDGERIKKVG